MCMNAFVVLSKRTMSNKEQNNFDSASVAVASMRNLGIILILHRQHSRDTTNAVFSAASVW